jgi:type II secretory pathway pseudopilin PulG
LVELLVVIAIISILAGLLLPALENALNTAHRIVCLSNQKQLYVSLATYSNDYNDWLPMGGEGTASGHPLNGMRYAEELGNRVWVANYLEIPLFQWSGASVTNVATQSPYWRSPNEGKPLGGTLMDCPGSRLRDAFDNPSNGSFSFGYRFPGLGAGHYHSAAGQDPAWPKRQYTRLSTIGTPYKGYAKTMIMDVAAPEIGTNFYYFYFYQLATGHSPGDYPKGMNSVAGDGSGKWTEDLIDVNRYVAVPSDRATLRYWDAMIYGTVAGAISIQVGPQSYYVRRGEKPAEFNEYYRAFFR